MVLTGERGESMDHRLNFELLFQALSSPLLVLDTDFNIIASNSAREKATGVSIEQSRGRNVFKVFPNNPNDPKADGVQKLKASLRRVLETKLSDQMEIQRYDIVGGTNQNGDFEVRYWSPVNTPILDSKGNVAYIIHRVDDVTAKVLYKDQQKKLAAELRANHELRELINLMPIPIAIFRGPEHRYSLVNSAHNRMLGKKVEGLTIREAHVEAEEVFKLLDTVYKTGKPSVTLEHHYNITDSKNANHDIWLHEWFNPFHDEDGNIVGILACAQEVTTQVKARAEAQSANTAKSHFLAGMSHEIRTPLGAMLGFSSILKEDELSHEERVEYADRILYSGNSLMKIVNEILDLSKVEAGKIDIESIDFSIHDEMVGVINLLKDKAKQKGLYLSLQIDETVPQRICSDPARVRQILINLIGNALKFTKDGGVKVIVSSSDTSGDAIRIFVDVEDSGLGLTPEQQHKLFQPFTQADINTNRRFGGSGLGLVLSKELSKALGGDIILKHSTLGGGSTFRLEFEATRAKSELMAPVDFVITEPLQPLIGIKILVADDSEDNLFLVSRLLKKNGALVDTARDGEAAVAMALASSYDLILMDIQMPNKDGYQAIQELKAHLFVKPVIAFTGHAMIEERSKTRAAGFAAHLTKPIEPKHLIQTVIAVTNAQH